MCKVQIHPALDVPHHGQRQEAFACHCPHTSKGSLLTGSQWYQEIHFQPHPALALLPEMFPACVFLSLPWLLYGSRFWK